MNERLSASLKQARQLMQTGLFEDASKVIGQILLDDADQQDALYMSAVCQRYLHKFDDAADSLQRLKQKLPEYGRAFQEEGHLNLARDKPDLALQSFKMAAQYNPALIATWSALIELETRAGHLAEAAQATAQFNRLKALPPALLAVTNHIHEGRILQAEEIARTFLQKHPHHVEGMRLLADIGSRLGVHEDADFLLETAIAIEPENIQLRIDYIHILRKRQKFEAALAQATFLVETAPDNPLFKSLFAIECMQSGDFETALDMFDAVLTQRPDDPATLTSRGHALKTYGKSEDAIASYRAAIAAAPRHGDAWYALANLKTYTFSDDELTKMQAAHADVSLSFMARVHLAFALGKAFEDRKDYVASFEHYAIGNALKKRQARYSTEQMREEFAAQKTYCTPQILQKQTHKGHPAPDPIFIVGLPRAGSTLIEQILASHSQVDGTLELPNILSAAHKLRGRNRLSDRDLYPRVLADLSEVQLKDLGQEYISATRLHRKGAPFFTDKMPNNFRHIGLIHLILPNAKIIDARRDPLDCCWSGFKQLFAEGQEFTYDLEDIGQYYSEYVALMAHWERALPKGRILRVQHENVLDDLEGQVSRILEYCNLPFEDACLNFHETQRAVRTASSEQVRQRLNRSGQGRWKPYEPHLQPLKSALGGSI